VLSAQFPVLRLIQMLFGNFAIESGFRAREWSASDETWSGSVGRHSFKPFLSSAAQVL